MVLEKIEYQLTVSERDLQLYRYPEADKVERLGLKGIYLDNYFLGWDIKHSNLSIPRI